MRSNEIGEPINKMENLRPNAKEGVDRKRGESNVAAGVGRLIIGVFVVRDLGQ